jgi:ATP-dependent exoDNAse (exonuclease V) alpha subunit
MRADTVDKLLHEHAQHNRPPIPEYDLPPDTTLIVDEAATVSTPKLAALTQLADRKVWRVVLVGDPRQFAAVGRGGMFEHLVNTLGAVELGDVHRFTQPWEAQASLQLRAGNPQAIDVYDQHDRIHSGTPTEIESDILDAWIAARERGETVALMTRTNETVRRLNRVCQRQLIHTGRLDTGRPSLTVGGETLYEGDEVVTRLNNRFVQTDQRRMVKNRDHWTIQGIHPDGTLTLTGITGTVTLPAAYAAQHVELGYAQTSHTSQGRTVDTALLLIDTPTDHSAIYTP